MDKVLFALRELWALTKMYSHIPDIGGRFTVEEAKEAIDAFLASQEESAKRLQEWIDGYDEKAIALEEAEKKIKELEETIAEYKELAKDIDFTFR